MVHGISSSIHVVLGIFDTSDEEDEENKVGKGNSGTSWSESMKKREKCKRAKLVGRKYSARGSVYMYKSLEYIFCAENVRQTHTHNPSVY